MSKRERRGPLTPRSPRASCRRTARVSLRSTASDGAVHITFRDLQQEDIPGLMELQRALFPVQYQESFYNRLFSDGYYCLVGVTSSGEIVAVASARVVPAGAAGEAQSPKEAYIMTLGVKARREAARAHAACLTAALSRVRRRATDGKDSARRPWTSS